MEQAFSSRLKLSPELPPDLPLELPPELIEVSDQVGEFIQYWGFKKIHGRIWTHLFLSRHAMDSIELIARLKVSKALISISIKDLMKYQVIEKAGKSPQGTQLYRANVDIMPVILNVLREREQRMISRIHASVKTIQKLTHRQLESHDLDPARVQAVSTMVGLAEQTLDALLSLSSFDLTAWKRLRIFLLTLNVSSSQAKKTFSQIETRLAPLTSFAQSLRRKSKS